MTEKNCIQLKVSNILNVPLQKYDEFTFIVNGKNFKTTRIISDLLSPKICQLHINDPTVNKYIINTKHPGDFTTILNLCDFKIKEINDDESNFFCEVVEQLGNETIFLNNTKVTTEITEKNFISMLTTYERFPHIYANSIEKVIDFISSKFNELCETHEEEMKKLNVETIERILNNRNLHLKDEDQLLSFVNHLYMRESKYSSLYEYVIFMNVSSEKISEFIDIYDIESMSLATWKSICGRLKRKIDLGDEEEKRKVTSKRYESLKRRNKEFKLNSKKPFDGIINCLQKESEGDFENKIEISASSIRNGNIPEKVIMYDKDCYFHSGDYKNSWICFYFPENQIIPTGYSIKSSSRGDKNYEHPKS